MPAPTKKVPFVARSVAVNGRTWRFRVFSPGRATGERVPAIPVVLFLHGSGECGDDNEKQIAVGLGPHVRAHADTFPAIAVFPQAPANGHWTGETARAAIAALDAAAAEFGGDPERLHLTGLSRGGYGAWRLALAEPHRFAALVPICGGLVRPASRGGAAAAAVPGQADPFAAAAQTLRHLPIWIFHGALDDVVPPQQSRRMAAALRAAGADVRYTEFAEANHNSWDRAYAKPALWDWLFAQRRR